MVLLILVGLTHSGSPAGGPSWGWLTWDSLGWDDPFFHVSLDPCPLCRLTQERSGGGRIEERVWKRACFFPALLASRSLSSPLYGRAWSPHGRHPREAWLPGSAGSGAVSAAVTHTCLRTMSSSAETVPSLRGILVPAVKTIVCLPLLHLVPTLHLIKRQNNPGYDIS